MTAYVDLLVYEEIKQKNSSWSRQCGQVLHRVEVVEHYVGQCPHLRGERNGVQCLLLRLPPRSSRIGTRESNLSSYWI